MYKELFEKIGLNETLGNLYLELLKLGTQPASIIAKRLELERTSTYRNLVKLTELGIIKKTQRNKITYFFVEDTVDLKKYLDKKIKNLNFIKDNQKDFLDYIDNQKQKNNIIPKITIYNDNSGVNSIFEDIISNIQKKRLLTIRVFASNTYEEQTENKFVGQYAKKFYDYLEENKISIDAFVGIGNLIMEKVINPINQSLINLPATKSTINIILVGDIIYFIIYDNSPIGIKIESENMADAFHVIFDEMKK